MSRRLLAVDTATEACSVALWQDGQVLERFEVAGRRHTERLLPSLHALLGEAGVAMAQIDGFVCGVGPGSFAGVRIGVGLVKGLALALDRPVVPVSSLAMLAQAAVATGAERILASIDARMDEVYFGAYARDAEGLAAALQPERVLPPGQLGLLVPTGPWVAVGTGWGRHGRLMEQALGAVPASVDGGALPRAATALQLALPRFLRGDVQAADALSPAYLRDRVALTLAEQREVKAGPR